ncbi:hypothetical protein [Streptomyces sp. NBC_01232]|uniref:hypothetical protein n=1 Tax=Streptomyces sp. NBC_01232 TaxID=2903786 RepID=UPI003FA34E71
MITPRPTTPIHLRQQGLHPLPRRVRQLTSPCRKINYQTSLSGQPPLAVRTPGRPAGPRPLPHTSRRPGPAGCRPFTLKGAPIKLRTDLAPLAAAVTDAARALPAPAPVLAAIRLWATTGALAVAAFDYETSAQATAEAEVTTPGTVLVSRRLLADVTRTI